MIRDNVVPQEPRVTVVLDTSDVYGRESFEEAVRIVASLCFSACADNIPVSLRTTQGEAPIGGATGQRAAAFLDFLAAARPSRDDRGLGSIARIVAGTSGGSLVVVTGQPGGPSLAQLSLVAPRYRQVMAAQVGDPATALAKLSGVTLFSVESLEDFEVAWGGVPPR